MRKQLPKIGRKKIWIGPKKDKSQCPRVGSFAKEDGVTTNPHAITDMRTYSIYTPLPKTPSDRIRDSVCGTFSALGHLTITPNQLATIS